MSTEEKINRPEPPDGSIVGWGHPVRGVHVRIDEYEARNEHGEHWFLADDDAALDADPLSWDALLCYREPDGEPYLLVRRDLEASQ